MELRRVITSKFYYYQWLFNTRKLRTGFPKYQVLSIQETIVEIITDKKSVSRFGDGEFRLLFPGYFLEFQEGNEIIREKLKEVLKSNLDNHLVCIPEQFFSGQKFDIATKYWWKKFINNYGKKLTPFLTREKIYGNSFISRFYLGYKNKSVHRTETIINSLKNIWAGKNILIVEGRFSRLGVGNDLFESATFVERIICPDKNAFRFYDKIYEAAKTFGKDKIILIALGPTATILAHDLAKINYWAVDIGHIDIEYMWFLNRATKKIAIAGRHVNEAEKQETFDIQTELLESYNNSIILHIT